MAFSEGDAPALNFTPPLSPLDEIEKVLRTPDESFAGLNGVFAYNERPNYFQSEIHGSVRIHYLDEGPRDAAETVICMHGEPTWCFLYRHMIPLLVDAGFRVLAPDLVGFGKSDKPAARGDYSYEREVDWMTDWLVGMKVRKVTAFVQDWGGLIGLRVIARCPERFARVVVSNTAMPIGGGDQISAAFARWANEMSQQVPSWGGMVSSTCQKPLSEEAAAAYEAPFPSEEYKSATRVFPRLVPLTDGHMSVEENLGAWRRVYDHWQRPLLTLFASDDAVSQGGEKAWQMRVPGARDQPHEIIPDAGHFLQEDQPELVCQKVIAFMRANPLP